jgi:hypothetical protein
MVDVYLLQAGIPLPLLPQIVEILLRQERLIDRRLPRKPSC